MHYKSEFEIFGLPLVHVAAGMPGETGGRGIAKGWIAIGDIAVGAIAIGGLAVGPLAIGGAALGLGTLAGLSIGYYALGGAAVGVYALGGLAIAWEAAVGGMAIAREYAIGGAAIAEYANDDVARAYFDAKPAFAWAMNFMGKSRWFIIFAFFPMFAAFRRRRG